MKWTIHYSKEAKKFMEEHNIVYEFFKKIKGREDKCKC